MGYRSDVKFILTSNNENDIIEAKKALISKIKQNYADKNEKYDDTFIKSGLSEECVNGKFLLKFKEDYTKWYSSYPEVNAFHDWLDELADKIDSPQNDSYCFGYHFVRLGEALDDLVERIEGEPFKYIKITRSISFE